MTKKSVSVLMALVMVISILMVIPVSGSAATVENNLVATAAASKQLSTPKITKVENTASGVKITWNKVKGATKYRVFRKTKSSGWKKIGDTIYTSYLNKSAKSGTKYIYTVRCISKDGKKFTSGYNSKGKTINFIAAPKIKKLQNTSSGVKITWNKVKGASKYRVFRKTKSSGWKKLGDTTSTSFLNKSAKSGTKYTYTVRCVSKDGKKYTSDYYSKGKTITCKKSGISDKKTKSKLTSSRWFLYEVYLDGERYYGNYYGSIISQTGAYIEFSTDGTFKCVLGFLVYKGTYTVSNGKVTLNTTKKYSGDCTYKINDTQVLGWRTDGSIIYKYTQEDGTIITNVFYKR